MTDIKDTEFLEFEEEDFDTVLAPDINFTGTVQFAKPFMIKGKVTGSISATSDLFIDTDSVVRADIHAERVVIKGSVTGNVTASRVVHVFSSGSLTGDIKAPEVVLESGCFFSGACVMTNTDTDTE